MSGFERRFGKYAIRNLTGVLILCYVAGYIIEMINPAFINYLTLNPYAILHGQIWRLLTWVIVPPSSSNFIFTLIMLFFYFSIGTQLERVWGTYNYNVYMFLGFLFTIAGAFLMLGISYLVYPGIGTSESVAKYFMVSAGFFSTYYVNMSIFLAYAATFPDSVVLFMFIIPLKVKWLGIIYAVFLLYQGISYISSGIWQIAIAMAASLLNFLIYWLKSRGVIRPGGIKQNVKNMNNARRFRQGVSSGMSGITKHKCAICGRTEADSPNMQFRFCSKCEGNYEYCEEHLYTHKHVKIGDYTGQWSDGQ